MSTDEASPSPLGRYRGVDEEADARLYDVHLLGVPIDLFLTTRQHHDELIREFAVMGLGHGDEDVAQPADLRLLIQELGVTYARADTRTDREIEVAAAAGLESTDLLYRVPASVVVGSDRLDSMMVRADEFCRQGLMLTMPRSPEMVEFADWWLQELRRQVAGHPPTPWSPRPRA
ncbi:MAG: hypothetical protein JWN96_4157 [Mycobacterium sp.]|nr:hypothetical protein [Mycobacterium sp.]